MSARKDTSPEEVNAAEEHHYHVVAAGRQYLLVRHTHVWHPPTDVLEDHDGLHIVVEIAGMRQGEFHVTLHGRQLTISGVRPSPTRGQVAYHQLEVRRGEFRTDIDMPWAVDEQNVIARYHDGFLYVDVPRAVPTEMRVVEVEKTDNE